MYGTRDNDSDSEDSDNECIEDIRCGDSDEDNVEEGNWAQEESFMDEDNDKATDLGLESEGKDDDQDQDQKMEDSDVNAPEALAHGSNFPSPTLFLTKLPILTLPSFHQ
ncbi:hypothetical protein H0H87_008011 [Tephrocybe sp. NHM501043]|nr:hypothetical protein H0H87_008011 [Tephrocybe sp. NHM501043]